MRRFVKFLAVLSAMTVLLSSSVIAKSFSDMPQTHWAYTYIDALAADGIIDGYADGSFLPDNKVTRAEWCKLFVTAANLPINNDNSIFEDVQNHWALSYVNVGEDYFDTISDTMFYPDNVATRMDVTISLVRILGIDIEECSYESAYVFKDSAEFTEDEIPYVAAAVDNRLISGFDDGNFYGKRSLTRAQAATLLYKAFYEN